MNELTKAEAFAIANFIDAYLFTLIRQDEEADNIWWLKDVLDGFEKLCRFSKYGNVPNDGEREKKMENRCIPLVEEKEK